VDDHGQDLKAMARRRLQFGHGSYAVLRHDYALLKDRLPARNQLKCDAWLALRRRCRGG